MTLQPTSNAFPKQAFQQSVQDFPTKGEAETIAYSGPMTFMFAQSGDEIPEWRFGTLHLRDRALRVFWKSETMLAGAVNAVCEQHAAFEWNIEGPPETVKAATELLHSAVVGHERGWIPFISALSQDLVTCDNGAFMEIMRVDNANPLSPVVGIGHLDSAQCFRTGNPDFPVIYEDMEGKKHWMPWWSIVAMAQLPSPDQRMRGAGFSAVSRVVRYAQLLKNIAIYKSEKVSGRFYRAIHFVGGVSRSEIKDLMNRGEEEADNKGQTRFIMPQIIASLDPEKPISTATIDLASLPDQFDLDIELKWYITGLAMGFGVDYQDFAPLPGGNLGTSTQSEVLHKKSSAKSPSVFMQTLENVFKYYGVLPQNVVFTFEEKDLAAELEEMQIRKQRIEARAIQLRSGEITPEVARELALRAGDLEPEDVTKIPTEYGISINDRNDRARDAAGGDTIGKRVNAEPKQEFD